MQGAFCPDVRRVVTNTIPKIAWQEADAGICPVWRGGAGKTSLRRSYEQNEPKIQLRYLAWNAQQQNSAACFTGNANGVFKAREIRKSQTSELMGQRSREQL